jgi:pyruvate dehydrogenase E2 component (dihydrolipoamide acetyltransferase)
VDLAAVTGSGVGGRVTLDDVLAARRTAPEKPAAPPSPEEELPELKVSEDEAEVEDAPFRLKTQARRVVSAKHAVPHFYVTAEADVTELLSRKEELKDRYGATVTHLVMLGCLKTLAGHPELNRSYDRGKIFKWKGVHLGLAVDTDRGLTVAVLREAQEMGLQELVDGTGELVEAARGSGLSPEQRRHPTFVVSNLGMFEVEHFQAILNPPAAVTLAVSSALERPVVRDGSLEVGRTMGLTVSCDHRIVDGVTAARFLADLKHLLQEPDRLLGDE